MFLFLGWRFFLKLLSCPLFPPPFQVLVSLPVHLSVRPLTLTSAYDPHTPHHMTSPLSILVCSPPSCTEFSAICLTASAHLVAAEPLHLVLQNVGFAEVSLHIVHRMALARLPPPWCLMGRTS